MTNFDGSEIIVFSKSMRYYEIYGITGVEDDGDLIGSSKFDDTLSKRIDFYSDLKLIGSGYCRDIVWHQFKNQFAIIAGFDDKDQMVEYKVTKEKKGFFRGGR